MSPDDPSQFESFELEVTHAFQQASGEAVHEEDDTELLKLLAPFTGKLNGRGGRGGDLEGMTVFTGRTVTTRW
jgi:hypothetical protein